MIHIGEQFKVIKGHRYWFSTGTTIRVSDISVGISPNSGKLEGVIKFIQIGNPGKEMETSADAFLSDYLLRKWYERA